jgi:hypothetical protein
MKIPKIISILLIAVILAGLYAGCNSKQNTETTILEKETETGKSTELTETIINNDAETIITDDLEKDIETGIPTELTQIIPNNEAETVITAEPTEEKEKSAAWGEYIIYIAEVIDELDYNPAIESAPDGRYMRVVFMCKTAGNEQGHFIWNNIGDTLAKYSIYITDSSDKTYTPLRSGTTEISFTDGAFGMLENPETIFIDFDIPAAVSFNDLKISIDGQIISLE